MMAMKMYWRVQNDLLWSEASNSQRLYSKLIPAGHSTWFFPCTRESQVCKPHTAAQISSLNSQNLSSDVGFHMFKIWPNQAISFDRKEALKAGTSCSAVWPTKEVSFSCSECNAQKIHPIISYYFIIDSLHSYFFKYCINIKHYIFRWDYIIIMWSVLKPQSFKTLVCLFGWLLLGFFFRSICSNCSGKSHWSDVPWFVPPNHKASATQITERYYETRWHFWWVMK